MFTSEYLILKTLWEDIYLELKEDVQSKRDLEVFEERVIKKKTLEEVGLGVGLTKERVRQIEKRIRGRLLQIIERESLQSSMHVFYKRLWKALADRKIIDLDTLKIHQDEYELFDFIVNDLYKNHEIVRVVDNVVILRSEYERILCKIHELTAKHKVIWAHQILPGGVSEEDFQLYDAVLRANKSIVSLDKGQYYFSQGSINKKEEIYIIIYRAGRPLHYTQVPKEAKKFGLLLTTKSEENILASMQRNDLLKNVAPGKYALKEWDIPKTIHIRELIYIILRDFDRPLLFEELYEEIQKRRIDSVSKGSVKYYIWQHEGVLRTMTGHYILKEWAKNPRELSRYALRINQTTPLEVAGSNQLMTEIFKAYGNHFIKYKLSQGAVNASRLQVSSKVEIDFYKRVVIIQKDKLFNFNIYNKNRIFGFDKWHYVPALNEIFYLEFINEKVIRFLSEEEYEEYKPIDEKVFDRAQLLWKEEMAQVVDVSNVNVGEIYKNKATLYRKIGVEPASGVKNRKYQDQEVGRYLSFKRLDENKRSIVITEVFLEGKLKIDNRGKHGNQSGNSIYAKDMDLLVTPMVQREKSVDASYNTIFTREIPLFTKEYEKSRLNNSFCISHVNFIEHTTINAYLKTVTNKVLGAFLRSLDRLKRKEIINYKCRYKVIYAEGAESRSATADEVRIIQGVQSQVYKRLGIDSKRFIPHHLRLQCRKEIINLLRESTKIYSFWNSYEVTLIDLDLEIISDKEISDALKRISKAFIISTHESLNSKTTSTKVGDRIKTYSPFKSSYQISKIIKLDDLFWVYNRENIDSKTPFYSGQYLTNKYSEVLINKYNKSYEERKQENEK